MVAPSTDENLLSRCGIYCGACYIYRAQRDGGEFLDHVAAWQKAPKEMVRCRGCLGPLDEMWQTCRRCVVRSCLEAKGYGFCHECPGFEDGSCEKYERLSRFCAERGEDIRGTPLRMRAGEAEGWLREQDEKWRCPSCGRPASWYEKSCHHCGGKLKD
ncbi:DUF3795 domain-containing protein [Candidatus Bathyarchaeota archaeon]|nr:DUF3795 domain-containing protein [Candidatus Bathyarchaeota archaeon]